MGISLDDLIKSNPINKRQTLDSLISNNTPSLAERTIALIKRTIPPTITNEPKKLVEDISPISLDKYKRLSNVVQTMGNVEEKIPTRELLPPALGIAGAMVGGIPGAIVGGTAGKAMEYGLGRLSGKPEETYSDIAKKSGLSGLEQGAWQAGGKVAEAIINPTLRLGARGAAYLGEKYVEYPAIKNLVQKLKDYGSPEQAGMKNAVNFLKKNIAPTENFDREAIISKYKDKPIKSNLQTPEVISKKLSDINLTTGATDVEQVNKIKDLMNRGLSRSDAEALLVARPDIETSLGKIATGESGKLKATNESAKELLSDYKLAGSVLNDLNKEKLTFGELEKIQNIVGEKANLLAKDRTDVEKFYGRIYNKIEEDLRQTAKDNKFLSSYNKVNKEGKNYYQMKFINSAVENSTLPDGNIDFNSLYKKFNLTEDQMVKNFGDNIQFAKTIRDLAYDYSKRLGAESGIRARVSKYGIQEYINPMPIIRKMGAKSASENIAARNLDLIQKQKLADLLYPEQKGIGLSTNILGQIIGKSIEENNK